MKTNTKHRTLTIGENIPIGINTVVVVSGGSVTFTDADDNAVTYDDLPALSTFEEIRFKKILSDGTTATKIVGWS